MVYNKCNTNILRENVMKKFLFYVLILSVFVLAACGETEDNSSEEEGVATGESTNEMSELEKENEELRRQLEEQEDDNGTGSSDTAEGTESEDNQNDNTEGNRSDLVFDINSSEVQAYINKNDNYDDEGNFVQDAISVGMTQSEIETLYGMHDYTVPATTTEAAAIYENIAVVYEERGPYVADTDSNIDPDNNRADWVLYFANLPVDEVLNTMGSPDEQLTNLMGTQNYIYEGNSSNDGWGTIMLSEHDTPEGLRIGSLSVSEDERVSNDDSNSNTAYDNEIDYEMIEAVVSGYMHRLEKFYNNEEYPDILLEVQENSPAHEKLVINKESGSFENHTTYEVEINMSSLMENGMVHVDASRLYSHVNTNGQRVSTVHYVVDPETNKIIDFEAVSDEAY